MSYRTYINDQEWLGNNEGPSMILDELKRQGCPIDEDGCTYDEEKGEVVYFQIKDLDALVKVTEQAIFKMVEENPKVADFNSAVDFWKNNFTYGMSTLQQGAYIFWSAKLLDLVGKDNYIEVIEKPNGLQNSLVRYKLKEGVKCEFHAG